MRQIRQRVEFSDGRKARADPQDLTILNDHSNIKKVMSKRSYSVSEFKAKSLGLLEKVARSREIIIITKRGKPIAQVLPIPEPTQAPEPGKLKDALLSEEDVVTPLGGKLWKASE
jgi:prevent-host-death family protein